MNLKIQKKRLIQIQAVFALGSSLILWCFVETPFLIAYFCGTMVMLGAVWLFATFAELLLTDGQVHPVRLLLLLPLKLGLLLMPFLVLQALGMPALLPFGVAVVLSLFPLLFVGRTLLPRS